MICHRYMQIGLCYMQKRRLLYATRARQPEIVLKAYYTANR